MTGQALNPVYPRPTKAEVEALMKRCQKGVGGRNALDDAHSIMAECYGTLGALQIEREQLADEVGTLLWERDALQAARTKLNEDIAAMRAASNPRSNHVL